MPVTDAGLVVLVGGEESSLLCTFGSAMLVPLASSVGFKGANWETGDAHSTGFAGTLGVVVSFLQPLLSWVTLALLLNVGPRAWMPEATHAEMPPLLC